MKCRVNAGKWGKNHSLNNILGNTGIGKYTVQLGLRLSGKLQYMTRLIEM